MNRNFSTKNLSAIKAIFLSTNKDKENDKNLEKGGKMKLEDEDKNIGKRIDNKIKELLKYKLKPKESFQPYYDKSQDFPKFPEGIPCMKLLIKSYCHSKCFCLHNLMKDQEKECNKFFLTARDQIKEQDFQ